MNEQILEKWKILIDACKAYYVDAVPTGLTDSEYDWMEKQAMIEDSFPVRDYVFQTFLKGTKTKNAWIEKIKKTKVTGKTMFDAIREVQESRPSEKLYFNLKYDGSSIAIYIDPTTGNINPDLIEAAITPKTTAIMPVHVYGKPCDTKRIKEIADTYGLKGIYDAAHAFGVKFNG